VQWVWYAFGGGLPRRLAPWVLSDTTRRTWIVRHVVRAVVQMLPVVVFCFVVPVPWAYRLSAAFGGMVIGLLFSIAFMTETIEHRSVKAGYPPGMAAQVRERRQEKQEQERLERLSPYRHDGAGSFD